LGKDAGVRASSNSFMAQEQAHQQDNKIKVFSKLKQAEGLKKLITTCNSIQSFDKETNFTKE